MMDTRGSIVLLGAAMMNTRGNIVLLGSSHDEYQREHCPVR